MTNAQRMASIQRHARFLLPEQRATFAPSKSEEALKDLARRMGVRLPGGKS